MTVHPKNEEKGETYCLREDGPLSKRPEWTLTRVQ